MPNHHINLKVISNDMIMTLLTQVEDLQPTPPLKEMVKMSCSKSELKKNKVTKISK